LLPLPALRLAHSPPALDHLSDEDEDATKKKYNHDDKQVVRDCLPKVDFDAAPEMEANSNDNCTA
jgi:hypothetical protein